MNLTTKNKIEQTQKDLLVTKQVPRQQVIQLMGLVCQSNNSLALEIQKKVDENPALEIDNEETEFTLDTNTSEESPLSEFDEDGDPLELSSETMNTEEAFEIGFQSDDDGPTEAEIEKEIRKTNAPEVIDYQDRSLAYSATESQIECWKRQLDEMYMSESDAQIADYLMGCLDERGYLTVDLQAIVYELIIHCGVYSDVQEVERVLTTYVQELDPVGTGARSLQECLLIQLKHRSVQDEDTQLAIRVLTDCFDYFAKKHFEKICQTLSITDDQLKRAYELIRKLDPRPADSGTPMEHNGSFINPDFTIAVVDGKLNLSLNNQYVPKVRLNRDFARGYLQNKEAEKKRREEAEKFVRTYVDKANQFISLLSTREIILYNTMYAIMRHQERYFLTGDDADLRPMILKNIAQEVGVDVATVSRVSNSKYVQTNFGIISLKHLFSEAVNDDDISSKAIKSVLNDIIENEDKKKPLSDEKLVALLKERGYDIARRTVAKYREQLNIPVARLRKEMA